jgi:DNA-binding NarL/FixJ family response regulator
VLATGEPAAHNSMVMNPITVLLADDHMIFREGLRSLLALEPGITVVGEAENGREAVLLAKKLRPAVVVMDIAMPLLNGLDACQKIAAILPETKVIILSAHGDEEYIEHMTQVGASGYLIKQTSAHLLARGIRTLHEGGTFYSPGVAKHLRTRPGAANGEVPKKDTHRLTPREREVLQLVAEGNANKQIASDLRISIKTVEKHRQALMDKLSIHETAGLTRYAISHGLIESRVQTTIV